ncbi:MAG: type II toxin-antitoxin system HicB family antitoxin [Polyangiaceae bacterium]|nr:type II toxin-antitoxin system HicB family antitoxin [Polyangiaceae bacterium]
MFYIAKHTREGKHHLATFPDAPGCQTFADSLDTLRTAAKEAIEGWLEANLVSGQVPPEPKPRTRGLVIEIDPALAVAIELRRARLGAGLTQAELAARAGVSQQQIAKLERPGENPSIETLKKVGQAMGVHPVVTFERASGVRKAG